MNQSFIKNSEDIFSGEFISVTPRRNLSNDMNQNEGLFQERLLILRLQRKGYSITGLALYFGLTENQIARKLRGVL